jgi:hypothetical protein
MSQGLCFVMSSNTARGSCHERTQPPRKSSPSITGTTPCSPSAPRATRPALHQRPVRDDRPGSRGPAADPRLQHRQRQPRENLEFFSIKVPDGPLTSRCSTCGRAIRSSSAASRRHAGPARPETGQALFLFATGTGLAPFMSLIHDPGNLRALREDHPDPRRALDQRTGLSRLHRVRTVRPRVLRRLGAREADLLPDGDPRAFPQ